MGGSGAEVIQIPMSGVFRSVLGFQVFQSMCFTSANSTIRNFQPSSFFFGHHLLQLVVFELWI